MRFPVFDGHCDTPVRLWRHAQALADNDGHVSLRRAQALDGYVQFCSFCMAWIPGGRSPEENFQAAYAFFQAELAKNRDSVRLVTDAAQAAAVLSGGGAGAMLSIEGAEAISCDPGRLEELKQAGVRMIAPVWNLENALAGSCETGSGLSAQGREFCRRAQRLGLLMDVSHLSERAFWQLCELAEKPVVASHSNSAAVCPHARNLTDDQFRALCRLGGTAGINLYAPFLNAGGAAALDDIYRHIDHFLSLGGEGHVALGADFDGCHSLPAGICGVDDYGKLAQYLLDRGYAEQTVGSIFSGALLRVMKEGGPDGALRDR